MTWREDKLRMQRVLKQMMIKQVEQGKRKYANRIAKALEALERD